MSRQIFQTLQRDPRVSPLANNGQARITTLDDENARIELAGELSTFVCDGQYGQAMERILQSYLAQQGQVEASKAVDGPGTTGCGDRPPGSNEWLSRRVRPKNFQRKIRLYAGTGVDLAAGIDRPATVWQLLAENPLTTADDVGVIKLPRPGPDKQIFTFEDRISLEWSAPVTVSLLPAEEPLHGLPDGQVNEPKCSRCRSRSRPFIVRSRREGRGNGVRRRTV